VNKLKRKIKLSKRINHKFKAPEPVPFIIFFTDGTHTIIEEVDDRRIIGKLQHSHFEGRIWKSMEHWNPENFIVDYDILPDISIP